MHQIWIKILIGVGIIMGSSSCNSYTGSSNDSTNKILKEKKLLPAEYIKWIQDTDNGIKKEKVIDDITFTLQYKPYEYIVCMEEKKEQLPDSLVKKKTEEISDMQYYDLTIALTENVGELLRYKATSYNEYDQRIKYASFDMQKDIKLVENDDTIPCSLFHFERVYNIAPYAKFLLGFANIKNSSPIVKVIIFNDNLFNKGLIKFTYTDKDFNNIPKLKTNDAIQ